MVLTCLNIHPLLHICTGQRHLVQGVQCAGGEMSSDGVRWCAWSVSWPDGIVSNWWQVPWHKLSLHGRLCRQRLLLCRNCLFAGGSEGTPFVSLSVCLSCFSLSLPLSLRLYFHGHLVARGRLLWGACQTYKCVQYHNMKCIAVIVNNMQWHSEISENIWEVKDFPWAWKLARILSSVDFFMKLLLETLFLVKTIYYTAAFSFKTIHKTDFQVRSTQLKNV